MRSFTASRAAVVAIVAIVAACSSSPSTSPSTGSASGASDLTGKTWQLTAVSTTSPTTQSVIANPALYTIRFGADGTATANAKCNTISGIYETSGTNGITIQAGIATIPHCTPSRVDQAFLTGLARTSSYQVANSELTLTGGDGATMTFR